MRVAFCLDGPDAAVAAIVATAAAARDTLRRDLPGASFASQVLAGRPEQELVRYLDRFGADVVVLGARPGAPPGPASIGHVARFVLDHARCSALLVRPGAARDV